MTKSPKNIRYYFRSVNFNVDEYLRRFTAELPEKFCHAEPVEACRANIHAGSFAPKREHFIAVITAELQRGKRISELAHDSIKLLSYATQCQNRIFEQMRNEGLNNAEAVRAIAYLIEIASRKQKGGQRGVLKSRPVVFERVFTAAKNLLPLKRGRQRGGVVEYPCQLVHDSEFVYRLGAIIEIYNRATYAIDDVFDDSDYRMGELTLHRIFSDKIAILVGQFLHLWSLELLLNELKNVPPCIHEKIIHSFNAIHTNIYEMEVENHDLQEKLRNDYEFRIQYLRQPMKKKRNYYLKRMDLRTGKFYEHIVRIAALLATNNVTLANEWRPYGLGLGYRYLIDNDLKDLIDPYFVKLGTGSQGLKGKEHVSFMGDLEVGKITYPMLVALENNFYERIISMIGRKLTLQEKNEITRFVIINGGIGAAMKLMEHYADMSKQVLKKFEVKDQTLWELADLYR